MPSRSKKLLCLAVFVVIGAFGIVWYARSLLPNPTHKLDTYQQLTQTLAFHPDLVLPDEEQLPAEPKCLSVYIPSRLKWGAKAGYTIACTAGNGRRFVVKCRELRSFSRAGHAGQRIPALPEFFPNQTYRDVPVQSSDGVTEISNTFHTETCAYSISLSRQLFEDEAFLQGDKELVERITNHLIDKSLTQKRM